MCSQHKYLKPQKHSYSYSHNHFIKLRKRNVKIFVYQSISNIFSNLK